MRRTKLIACLIFIAVQSMQMCVATDSPSDGDRWLKWSDESKLAYIDGFLWGYTAGFSQGCKTGEKVYSTKEDGLPGEKCIAKIVGSGIPEHYVKGISEYYRTYPSDRDVPIRLLVEGLQRDHNMTTQQMHEYYSSSVRKISREK